jgi:hypothetical protein
LDVITQEVLKEVLAYDPATGIFTARKSHGSRKCGDVVGSYDSDGYLKTNVKGKSYRLHRLAWFYMTGKWPADALDHKNRVRDDNRFENLREATPRDNVHNSVEPNATGLRGVHFDRRKTARNKPYGARITAFDCRSQSHVRLHLGQYPTAEEANEVYELWAQMTHGEFYHG